MDAVFTPVYKNAEIEIVVEDDIITTAKIYMDGEFAYGGEVENENYPNGLPFNGKNYHAIKVLCAKQIDKMLAEDGRDECIDMRLVRR